MERTNEFIKRKMTPDKVSTLLLALEIIANGDPIGVGLDEVADICQRALDEFDAEDQ